MRLSNNNVELIELEVLEEIIEGNSLEVVSLSPIVAYKTPPGSKRHEYLHPSMGSFISYLRKIS